MGRMEEFQLIYGVVIIDIDSDYLLLEYILDKCTLIE